MITAKFTGENQATAFGLWQWDYGRALCIEGLQLPPCVEVQFSQCNTGGDAELVDGTTIDSKTYVPIPQHFLENESVSDYDFYAFVFLYDQNGGHTVKRIRIPVKSKPKPATYVSPDQESAFRAAVKEINEAATRAGEHELQAERWAVGREDIPESRTDNAKYYAGQARDAVHGISGQIDDAKADIDQYCKDKEQELKGDTGNVYFASFLVVKGRLKMYSDPAATKIAFRRIGSRLRYRVQTGG